MSKNRIFQKKLYFLLKILFFENSKILKIFNIENWVLYRKWVHLKTPLEIQGTVWFKVLITGDSFGNWSRRVEGQLQHMFVE
jgi:hypothetical protein